MDSAVRAMAYSWDSIRIVTHVAARVAGMLTLLPEHVRVRTFATFIPEIVSPDRNAGEIGQKALVFLCRVAAELRRINPAHDVRVIEIVGGSIVTGVVPVSYKGKTCLLAKHGSVKAHAVRLLQRLNWVLARAGADVKFAIEAEPGPLFAFRDESTINSLVTEIHRVGIKFPAVRAQIGLNLDIGHWLLSAVPHGFVASPRIRTKIFNAHVSDHARGHIGDAVVGTVHGRAVFDQWADALHQLPHRHFPRRVSVEFECAKDRDALVLAVQSAKQVFAPSR
jgi:sugar phosphate isomerase/epimerase